MNDTPTLADWRRRRTRAQVAQLERQILDVLAEDHPQSVRHVFYRLTDPRLPEPVEKTEQGYAQVQRRLVDMRRRGVVPYRWITDSTRRGYHVDTFASGGEFVEAMARHYRADLWRFADVHVEVWTESRSMAGVVQADCEDLAVSLYPAGGFASLTLAHQAAEYIRAEVERGDKTGAVVLYVGDYDPAGVLIDRAIEAVLREHLGADIPLRFDRLAINPDQITLFDLPAKPRKAIDRRRLDIVETVEAEAMPASVLRDMLRERIEAYLPAGELERVRVAEESERSGLRALGLQIQEGAGAL
ncbi:MAG: hypothetical protein OXC08_11815 [Thiotrichales bacterium]|nr:hypothetical protein [Thiotrichales bacterium]